ncbi:LTA synthase family protein [Aggregatibacter actinomycetemcomitans]|uniref:LTA synthase family protein n=3 Tax=Aggregatibacter actinomycetemcomitans TaxID=714 RepID=UPI00197C3D30|nr:LTA synthase family protein [Aggregatibacter actinomycetemcomitans]MBN6067908.1 LTA synthase family protein [Aggregatibacter actinomycetemcomitans]MBN6085845.1 LTA synthase family protein [Aggregatibacter actinomycetemcomitans]
MSRQLFKTEKTHSLLYPIFFFCFLNLIVFTLSRLGLSLWQMERVNAVHGWGELFLQGLRMDIVSLCYLFGVPALFSVLFYHDNALGRIWKGILRVWLTVSSVFILFMELSTPAFINTYDYRPNRLFIEYLIYPKEVFTMLMEGHLSAVILNLVFTIIAAVVYWKLAGRAVRDVQPMSWKWRPLVALLVIAVSFLGARSSLQHRGINPAMVAFSSDAMVNSLVLNSGYSVIYAAQQFKDEGTSSESYGKMETAEMLEIIKNSGSRPAEAYISDEFPTLTRNQATYQGKPKNIVIILEESFGAQFIGTLGGLPLSPEFDKLAQQGWLFDNLYATGTRSVRGIEAVTAGFTPTPARAVVKLNNSQNGFFTLAQLLSQRGYDTSFIYGGEKHFDNMAGFFYGNGFKRIIDQMDYQNPTFTGTWGVSDEDLFTKANETFTQLQKEGKPFFSLVFSSSNHDPFEFPDGKIELYEQPKATRNNAAKYADYAIGHFFKLAKESNYWKDTIFLVIADHDSRVAGASLMPIKHFHIPALILGDGIAPRRDNRLVSQFDMPTTLLSLAGISGDYPMIGYDLTKPNDPNRAIMQYDQVQALMRGNDVVLQFPKVGAKTYRYDKATETLTEAEVPPAMVKEALAHALLGSYLYKHRLYTTPEIKQTEGKR